MSSVFLQRFFYFFKRFVSFDKVRANGSGYILLTSVMIIAMCTTIVSFVVISSSTYSPFARTIIARERAKLLAFAGIECARSQLMFPLEKEKGKADKEKKPDEQEQAWNLLATILPHLNRWQTVEMKEKIDGVNGSIQLCIMCEDGKLNINELYDFNTHKFIGEGDPKKDAKKLFQDIFARIKEQTGGIDLFDPFEKFLKERQYKVRDITQLLSVKQFAVLKDKLFYKPLDSDKKERGAKHSIYLTDLFTLWSEQNGIEPWLLSHSMEVVAGFKGALDVDQTGWQEKVEQSLKQFRMKAQWSTDWNSQLASLYGVEFNSIPPRIAARFDSLFAPRYFSVRTRATVGGVTQELYAIMKRTKKTEQSAVDVQIKKVYWL